MNDLPTEIKFMILSFAGVCPLALCNVEWLQCALTLFPIWVERLKRRLRLKLLRYSKTGYDTAWLKQLKETVRQYRCLYTLDIPPVIKLSLAPGIEIVEQFALDKAQYVQIIEDRLCTDAYIVLHCIRAVNTQYVTLSVARISLLLSIKSELQPRDHRYILRYCEPQQEQAAMKIVELGVGTNWELVYCQKYLLWHACHSRSQKFSFVPSYDTFQHLPNLFNLTPKLVSAALRYPSSAFYIALIEHYGVRDVSSIKDALRGD